MNNKAILSMFLAIALAGCGWGINSDEASDGKTSMDGAEGGDSVVGDHALPDSGNDGNGGDGSRPDTVVVPDEELCGEEEFTVGRVIPDMLILLDRSRSMTMSTPPLWDIIRPAIVTVTSAVDDSVWFGLMSFPNSIPPNACSGSSNNCAAPTEALVPVGASTSGAIQSALGSLNTCGATPTAMSLLGAHQYLLTVADDHPKYILLATDGAPNCNDALDGNTCRCTTGDCTRNPQYCLDDARTLTTLDGICADGIKTFVLGMGGATEWSDVLGEMAVHGCTDTYYAAQDPAEIQDALEDITGGIATCLFDMDCSAIPDLTKVNFYFDGTVVPRNTAHDDGWDWVEPCESSTGTGVVEFFGSDCDKIMNREVETVSATFGCPTIII
jgi:hypothetical protein